MVAGEPEAVRAWQGGAAWPPLKAWVRRGHRFINDSHTVSGHLCRPAEVLFPVDAVVVQSPVSNLTEQHNSGRLRRLAIKHPAQRYLSTRW
jgi:hypothetical protein